MENQEKITLLAEISALEGQVIKDFDAEAVKAQAQQEYTAMQQDIVTQYEDARVAADATKKNKQKKGCFLCFISRVTHQPYLF